MYKILVIICGLSISGCSVAMINQESPLKLNGCHVWPAVVDAVIAVGAVGAATGASMMNEKEFENENAQIGTVGVTVLGASAFAMSAFMGFGEYYDCTTGRRK